MKYLKPNIVIEPLFMRWYAWSHLISPGTAAMNVVKRHIEIMNSYVDSPEQHMEAVKDPKMLGGPFMDYGYDRSGEVKALLTETLDKQSKMVQLAFAFRKLDKLLKSHPKGYALEELYDKIPPILKGYVELVYDLNNNLSFRIFEELLYHTEYFDKNFQSIALWITNNDSRPFSLSTPKLNESNILQLPLTFDNPIIDELSRMKRIPGSPEDFASRLNLTEEQHELFMTFFTDDIPVPYEKYTGDKVRMRYFGHACIFIETKDLNILIDPLISYYGYPTQVHHFSDYDLPDEIDYVLITHNHQDHILLETLLPLRHRIKNIVVPRSGGGALQDPKLKLMFNKIGFKNVIEIDEMETINRSDCSITGLPFTGEHSDLDIKAKTCYHVKVGDFSLLFSADSRVMEPKLYENIHRIVGDVDVIFLGMECDGAPLTWLYGPLMLDEVSRENDQSRTLSGCDHKRGMHLVNMFNPKEVYVYAMGQEPWCEFISSLKYTQESIPIIESNKLVDECLSKGLISERLFGEKEILYSKTISIEHD
jgi:L-ascorbate metabolism protein UlaG (beta-lactamase superfamily)